MNASKEKFYENQAATIIKNLSLRKMEGYYCKDISQAKEKMLELIGPKSKSVAYGGSMTLTDNGFFDEVKKAGHNLSLVVEKLGY